MDPGGAYTVAHSPAWNADVLAGFRYVGIDAEVKWNLSGSQDFQDAAGRTSQDITEWDGIVGVKGQVRLGDGHWFVPYYADIGTGSSNWTWQALLGLGYSFGWGTSPCPSAAFPTTSMIRTPTCG